MAKKVCPDAYSYAFDDQTSTFIVPAGGGFEVVFCPTGRSSNILATMGPELRELAATGAVSAQMLADTKNITLIRSRSAGFRLRGANRLAMLLVGTFVVLLTA